MLLYVYSEAPVYNLVVEMYKFSWKERITLMTTHYFYIFFFQLLKMKQT